MAQPISRSRSLIGIPITPLYVVFYFSVLSLIENRASIDSEALQLLAGRLNLAALDSNLNIGGVRRMSFEACDPASEIAMVDN